MILIVSATSQETAFLAPQPGIELLVTGVGPVEAAAQLSRALAQGHYDLVVSAGIAGSYSHDLQIGEGVVVAEERIELDLETGAPLALPAGLGVSDRAASDLALVDRLIELGFKSVRGMTVMRVTSKEATTQRMRELGVEIESMEGFAVLRAAEIAGLPAIEIRGISNYAGDRAKSQWNFAAGTEGLARIAAALLSLESAERP